MTERFSTTARKMKHSGGGGRKQSQASTQIPYRSRYAHIGLGTLHGSSLGKRQLETFGLSGCIASFRPRDNADHVAVDRGAVEEPYLTSYHSIDLQYLLAPSSLSPPPMKTCVHLHRRMQNNGKCDAESSSAGIWSDDTENVRTNTRHEHPNESAGIRRVENFSSTGAWDMIYAPPMAIFYRMWTPTLISSFSHEMTRECPPMFTGKSTRIDIFELPTDHHSTAGALRSLH